MFLQGREWFRLSLSCMVLAVCGAASAQAPPSLLGVQPSTGPTVGGISLTLIGANFGVSGATATIGGAICPATVQTPFELRCTLPEGQGRELPVHVTTASGTSTEPVTFSYNPPEITDIEPASGTAAGGFRITISGADFGTADASVTVGGNDCPIFLHTHSELRCTTPPGVPGPTEVRAAVAGQVSNAGAYAYVGMPPSVSTITPATGPTAGGVVLTVIGHDFGPQGAAASIGGAVCPVLDQSDTVLRCTLPAGQGAGLPVVVTTAIGTSTDPVTFSYNPPVIADIEPASGTAAGGFRITISGADFGTADASVTVGGNDCPIFLHTHSELRCTTPPGVPGPTEVRAAVAGQISNAGAYAYVGVPPSVSTIVPATGPTAGGVVLTVIGHDFGPQGAAASIGGAVCPVLDQSDTVLRCTLPAGQGAGLPVVVTTAIGTSTDPVTFSYNPPVVTGLDPTSGLAAGGFRITISGADFGTTAATVTVGGNNCPIFLHSHTEVRCTTPAGSGTDQVVQLTVAGQPSNPVHFSYSELCDAGYFSTNGTTLPEACTPCAPGSVAAAPGSLSCTPCASGTFQPAAAAEVCQPCQPCSDGDACTLDSCDAVDGSCAFPVPDDDHDAVSDLCDNCATAFNPGQDDADGDRVGDTCDNCPFSSNASQSDIDFDITGDICDIEDGLIYQLYAKSPGGAGYQVLWQAEAGHDQWNLYFSALDDLLTLGLYTQVPGSNPLADRQCWLPQPMNASDSGIDPAPGKVRFSLVSGATDFVEGSLGQDSQGLERTNANPCVAP